MSIKKFMAIGAGWFLAGPIGAIIGYYIGKSFFDGKNDSAKAYELSLLILSSLVIKADGKVLKSELDYVKNFFIKAFGVSKANDYFRIFNKLNKESLSSQLRPVCQQLNSNVNHASRLQIIHFLFGVAAADKHVHDSEISIIRKISSYLNINQYDFDSIKSMMLSNNNQSDLTKWYSILEIKPTATDEEIKKAHRKMVRKYHPDKLQGVSDDIVKLAEEKFLEVQKAYEVISNNRK